MNKSQALRILIAAQDDPVLAAWATVLHEHKAMPGADVSPYEYWEAFQELYAHGLVSPEHYNAIDAKRVFFDRHPPAHEIQRVLFNLRVMPESPSPSEPNYMSVKTKLPSNPFDNHSNGNALVANERGASLVGGARPQGLGAPRSAGPLNPFDQSPPLQEARGGIPLEPFNGSKRGQLSTRDNVHRHHQVQAGDIRLQIFCCGQELAMEVADMQAEGPDSVPGGQIAIIDRVLHGTCHECGREHHHSVGEVVRSDEYR